MTEILRVKGGIGALREGLGDFALNPHEKNNFVAMACLNYKNVLNSVIALSTTQIRKTHNTASNNSFIIIYYQSEFGFTVVGAAQNGRQALKLVEEHSPDLLLTDIRMPVLDGLELLKNIALNYPYIKTIIISGYSESEYAKQAIKYGVQDYLLKPLELDELRETLSKIKISLKTETNFLKQKISTNVPESYSSEEIITIVAHFIKENFNQEINLNSLAAHFNFNASYLSKLFKKHYDETPVKYLLNLRINKAKYLLHSQPELDIKTIGELVGYSDQFYFSRIFKHITGKSPSEFRELE